MASRALVITLLALLACQPDRPNVDVDVDGDGDGDGDGDADSGTAAGREDAGEPDAGEPDAAVPPDPCGDVPTTGHCLDERTLEKCVTPTGAAPRMLQQYVCGASEACSEADDGAACVQLASCVEGATRCADESTLEVCDGTSFVAQA